MKMKTSRIILLWKINLVQGTIMRTINYLIKFLRSRINILKIKIIIKNNTLLMLTLWKIQTAIVIKIIFIKIIGWQRIQPRVMSMRLMTSSDKNILKFHKIQTTKVTIFQIPTVITMNKKIMTATRIMIPIFSINKIKTINLAAVHIKK